MERFATQLEADRPLRDLALNSDERRLLSGYTFLTLKPLIIVLNHGEDAPPTTEVRTAAAVAGRRGGHPLRGRGGGAGASSTLRRPRSS